MIDDYVFMGENESIASDTQITLIKGHARRPGRLDDRPTTHQRCGSRCFAYKRRYFRGDSPVSLYFPTAQRVASGVDRDVVAGRS